MTGETGVIKSIFESDALSTLVGSDKYGDHI